MVLWRLIIYTSTDHAPTFRVFITFFNRRVSPARVYHESVNRGTRRSLVDIAMAELSGKHDVSEKEYVEHDAHAIAARGNVATDQ